MIIPNIWTKKNVPNHQPVFHFNMHILGSTRLLFTKPYIPNHTAILLTYENSLEICVTWSNWVKLRYSKIPWSWISSNIIHPKSAVQHLQKSNPLTDRTVFPGWYIDDILITYFIIFSNIFSSFPNFLSWFPISLLPYLTTNLLNPVRPETLRPAPCR